MKYTLLDRKKYYSYIKKLKICNTTIYIFWIVLNTTLGFFIPYLSSFIIATIPTIKITVDNIMIPSLIGAIIGLIIGIITYLLPYIILDLKSLEMEMKFDIYNKIIGD